jgi:hypothetical protein
MPNYRFSFLGADGNVQSSRVMEAESEDEARKIANNLLIGSRSQAIEVWNALRLVYRRSRVRAA